MRAICCFTFYAFVQSTCFAVELPVDLPEKFIPQDYYVTNWFSADLNADGRNDYLVVLERRETVQAGQNIHREDRIAQTFTRQPDGSYKKLERNGITVSCPSCEYGYAIEKFSSPTQITSWIPDRNTGVPLPAFIPSEITSLAEKGYRIIAWTSADLNGDGLNDYLVVEEQQNNSPGDPDIKSKQRPVLILVRQSDQSLRLVTRNDIAVLCSTCSTGNYTIEGFEKITATLRSFSIVNQSGEDTFQLYATSEERDIECNSSRATAK